MHVTDSTLQRAFFNIVRQEEFPPYNTLRYKDLQTLWADTGLRQNDLRDVLRILFERQHIDFQNDGRGLAVVITELGHDQMSQNGPHWGDLISSARDRFTLHQIAQRRKQQVEQAQGQERRSDQNQAIAA